MEDLVESMEMWKMVIQDDIEEENKSLLKLGRQNLQECRNLKRKIRKEYWR